MDTKKLRQKILDLAINGKLVEKEGVWEEKTLGEVCSFESGLAYSSDRYTKEGTPLIRISNITDGTIFLENCVNINESDYTRHFYVEKGDLLIAMSGATTGKMGVYQNDTRAILNQRVGNIKIKDCSMLCAGFRNLIMQGLKPIIEEIAYGGAQPNISSKMICALSIPLPPLAEQQRIVAKVEEWFALIDILETSKENLQQALAQAKNKILDLAINGKLVEKEGVWEEVAMNQVCKLVDGEKTQGERINLDAKFLRGKHSGNILKEGKLVPAGSVIILVDGENSGEVFTAPIEGYQGSTFKILEISNSINLNFLIHIISFYRKDFKENKVGSAIPHLNKKMFKELKINLPPLVEQQRIVAKVEELFSELDSIAAAL